MSEFGGLQKQEKTQRALYRQKDKLMYLCTVNSRVVSPAQWFAHQVAPIMAAAFKVAERSEFISFEE